MNKTQLGFSILKQTSKYLIAIFTLNSLLWVLIPAPNSRRILATMQWPALAASIRGV